MVLEPNQYERVIGVDVASKKLDVYDSAGKLKTIVTNGELEIAQAIASKIKHTTETLVVCEGTGGYEDHLVDVMHDHGINVAVVNPRQVRDFAKGHGLLEKTNKIDAAIIAKFGRDKKIDEQLKEQAKTDSRIENWLSVEGVGVITVAMNRKIPSFLMLR